MKYVNDHGFIKFWMKNARNQKFDELSDDEKPQIYARDCKSFWINMAFYARWIAETSDSDDPGEVDDSMLE